MSSLNCALVLHCLTCSRSRNYPISVNGWPCFGLALTFYPASFLWLSKVCAHTPAPTALHSESLLVDLPAGEKRDSLIQTPQSRRCSDFILLSPKHIAVIDRILKKEIQRIYQIKKIRWMSTSLEQYQSDEQQWSPRRAGLWSVIGQWQPGVGLLQGEED